MKIFFTGMFLLLAFTANSAFAANYNVKKDGTGNFTTIQACATAAVAGDTCLVGAGVYDERVIVANSGTADARIVFKSASTPPAKVRGFTVNKNYITIEGFELTAIGMSYDTEYHGAIVVSGGTGTKILNNFIHDTKDNCIGHGNLSFLEISSNTLDKCGVATAIIGRPGGPYSIQENVSDKIKVKLNNTISYTITLSPTASGTTKTAAQICADIKKVTYQPGIIPWTNTVDCSGLGADGRIHMYPYIRGPNTSVVLESISNNAYTALGLTMGAEVEIGHNSAIANLVPISNNILVQNNRISRVSDYFLPSGEKFVFRNNVMGPSDPANTIHIDGVQSNNVVNYLLIEGNRSVDNTSSDNHFFLTSANSNNWITRHNSTLRSKAGLSWGCNSCGTNTKLAHYNNTWYDTGRFLNGWNQIGFTNSINNLSRNNIWYRAVRHPGGRPYYIPTGTTPVDKDYDLVFESGDTLEDNDIFADPLFNNAFEGDISLSQNSPAIDAGGPLTTTVNAGSSSTSLVVTAAYAFQPGWAGVNPDKIAIGSVSNAALISSIDYTTNTIVLATPLSWEVGATVWLHSDSSGKRVLFGTKPDIGAFEYLSTTALPPSAPSNVRVRKD